MVSSLTWLVLVGPAALLLAAATAIAAPGLRPSQAIRSGTVAAWLGVVVAAVAGIATATQGLIESPTVGSDELGISLRLDGLSTVIFAMVALLGVVIYRYSCTYLDGDDRQGSFLARLAVTIAAVEVLVLAGSLSVLVAAWLATSFALHGLLLFYPERRGAVIAARKKFIVARLGDVLLITGAVLLVSHFATGNLEVIFQGATAAAAAGAVPLVIAVAAVCLALAAILKSAQFPTHGWLVEVMETPTPVSALLHAGILNAGPFLVIRMAFVMDQAGAANTLLIIVGGLTAVFASVVLLTQPSIKVALGYSSAAHMGFMLMICGTGVYAAALLHLVAHSFYKAHAFLSSGGAIDEARAAKVTLPARLGSPLRIAGSATIALALYLAVATLWQIDFTDELVVLAIGAILMLGTTQLVAPTLDSQGPLAGTLRASLLALGVTVSFFTLEAGAHHLLNSAAPYGGDRTVWQYLPLAIVLLAFTAVVIFQIAEPSRQPSERRRALAIHLRNGLYANAAFDRIVGSLRLMPDSRGATR